MSAIHKCPECGSEHFTRERRKDGFTRCTSCGYSAKHSAWDAAAHEKWDKPAAPDLTGPRDGWVDNDDAITRWDSEFDKAGFHSYALDFSGVQPEVIEAMGRALYAHRVYGNKAPEGHGRDAIANAVSEGRVEWLWSLLRNSQHVYAKASWDSFGALRHANTVRCELDFHPINDWSLTDWMTAVAGEVGELAEELQPYPALHELGTKTTAAMGRLAGAIKTVRRLQSDGSDMSRISVAAKRKIADEAADIVIYLDLLLKRIDIDLGEAVRRKFNEVSDRIGSNVKMGAS